MKQKREVALINAEDLSLVKNNALNPEQLAFILKRTPPQYVKTRPAKGGGNWDYVSVSYVQKVLNLMFGFRWSFKVLDSKFDLDIGQVYVLGRLTVKTGTDKIVKEQYGRCDIKFKKHGELPNGRGRIPLDIGNDLKAASSDALKKCASLLGIAADIYGKDDFREVQIVQKPKDESEAALTEKLRHFLSSCTTVEEIDFVVDNFTEHREKDITKKQQKLIEEALAKITE